VGLSRRTVDLIAGALFVCGLILAGAGDALDRHDAAVAAEEVKHQAELLGAALGSASEAAHLRAESLATLPVVRAAIETDVATVRDLQRSGTVFAPAPGEAIELTQLGEHPLSLLRAPESATPLVPFGREVQLAEDGEALAVTASAKVAPMYEAGKSGVIAVRRPVALDGLRRALVLRELDAALTGLEAPLLVAGDGARPRWTLGAVVPFSVEPRIVLQAARRGGGTGALGGAGWALAALGIALAAMVRVQARRANANANVNANVNVNVNVNANASANESANASANASASARTYANARVTPIVETRLEPMLDEPDSLPQLVPIGPEPSSRLELLSDPLIAGRYRIIHSIGPGHGSEAYLAQTVQQVGVPKVIALKLLPLDGDAERLLDGMQYAARLHSPHIVRVHDYGAADERFYVAMEYVEGCSAERLLRELRITRETMPLTQSLTIALEICRALEAAHRVPLPHGDLRPSSVLIGRHGAVKLGDFGSARPRWTAFSAPEEERSVRGDLFSVGMLLNELVAGIEPPRSLVAVIAKATQASPRRRYQTAALLRADLEDVLEAVAEPPSSGVLGDWVERVRRSHA